MRSVDHGRGLPLLEQVCLAACDGVLVRAEVLLGAPPLHAEVGGEAVAAAGGVEVAAVLRPPQPPQAGLDVHGVVLVAAVRMRGVVFDAEAAEAALTAEAVIVLERRYDCLTY